MAKLKKGILGPIVGKLGPVIGSSWKGVPYLKTAYTRSQKERIPSAAQQAHHKKFSFLTRWMQPLHPYVVTGFRNFAEHTTEINAAFSYNFKQALRGNSPDFYMDYESVRLSRGNLMGMKSPTVDLADKNVLHLAWKTVAGGQAEYNDQLMLVLYDDETRFADGFTGGVKRAAKTCTFTFDDRLRGKYFHVFVGFISINGLHISDSQYLGKIDPL